MNFLPYILLFTTVLKTLFFNENTPEQTKLYMYVYGVMLLIMAVLHKLEDWNFRKLQAVHSEVLDTLMDMFEKLRKEREENVLLKKEIEVMKRERGIE